jgi:aminopeptidase-like protein
VAFLKYVENEYCAKHRRLPVNKPETIPDNNLISSAMASRSGYSSSDPYHLSSNDDEYLMPNNVAETTPEQSDHAVRLLTAPRLYLNSPPALPQNWGQIDLNLNNHHSSRMEISSRFWLTDIADCWRRQEETHS